MTVWLKIIVIKVKKKSGHFLAIISEDKQGNFLNGDQTHEGIAIKADKTVGCPRINCVTL